MERKTSISEELYCVIWNKYCFLYLRLYRLLSKWKLNANHHSSVSWESKERALESVLLLTALPDRNKVKAERLFSSHSSEPSGYQQNWQEFGQFNSPSVLKKILIAAEASPGAVCGVGEGRRLKVSWSNGRVVYSQPKQSGGRVTDLLVIGQCERWKPQTRSWDSTLLYQFQHPPFFPPPPPIIILFICILFASG